VLGVRREAPVHPLAGNRRRSYFRRERVGNTKPPNGYEVNSGSEVRTDIRVITGLGFRMHPGDITSMQVGYRVLSPAADVVDQAEHDQLWILRAHLQERDQVTRKAGATS
jgi:hypothetical protein